MSWIKEMELGDSLDELKFLRSVYGKDFPNFGMLDAKIASALNKIIQNSHFKKKVSLEEQKAQKEDRFLRGRQIAFMIYDNFRVTGVHDTALDYADLFSVTLHDDNIQEFDIRWDEVLLYMSKIPSDDVLERLYKLRIRESEQLKTVLEFYEMEFNQKISMPNCQKLKNTVKRSFDQKIQLRNFDARHERIETEAALKEGKVLITSGKKKASVRKETNAFSGMRVMITHKNQTTMPPHLPSHPFHDVEVCRGSEVSEAQVTMVHSSTTVQILFERYLHAIGL